MTGNVGTAIISPAIVPDETGFCYFLSHTRPSIVSFLLYLNAVMRGSNLLCLLYLVSVLVCNSFLSLPDVIKVQ